MLQSYPLPLFFGVLNPLAKPYVPRFTKEQMESVMKIQEEELISDSEDEEFVSDSDDE